MRCRTTEQILGEATGTANAVRVPERPSTTRTRISIRADGS